MGGGVSEHTHVCERRCVCAKVLLRRFDDKLRSKSSSPTFFETESPPLCCQPSWSVSAHGVSCLSHPTRSAGVMTDTCYLVWFDVDLNSGPYTCIASALLPKSSPCTLNKSPLFFLWYKGKHPTSPSSTPSPPKGKIFLVCSYVKFICSIRICEIIARSDIFLNIMYLDNKPYRYLYFWSKT